MKIYIELLFSFLVFLLFPALSSITFLFMVPVVTWVQRDEKTKALWTILFFAIIQEALISPLSPSMSLPLILVISLMSLFSLLSKVSFPGKIVEIFTVIFICTGFLLYKLFVIEAPSHFGYISVIIESLVVSLSLYIAISFSSWFLQTGIKRLIFKGTFR